MKILKISMLSGAEVNAKINQYNIVDRKGIKCNKCIAVIISDSQSSASKMINYKIGIQNLMKAIYDYI